VQGLALMVIKSNIVAQSAVLSTSVTLRHPTDTKNTDPIEYRVRASQPHLYSITPATGKLECGQSVTVNIVIQFDETSATNDDYSTFLNMHEDTFLIQSAAFKKVRLIGVYTYIYIYILYII
jgi:MSP (Major sperm protein) domain